MVPVRHPGSSTTMRDLCATRKHKLIQECAHRGFPCLGRGPQGGEYRTAALVTTYALETMHDVRKIVAAQATPTQESVVSTAVALSRYPCRRPKLPRKQVAAQHHPLNCQTDKTDRPGTQLSPPGSWRPGNGSKSLGSGHHVHHRAPAGRHGQRSIPGCPFR